MTTPTQYLSKIIERKKYDIEQLYQSKGLENIKILADKARYNAVSFKHAITRPGLNTIAEVKKASPSKGIIRRSFEPTIIAADFEAQGAAAISVLTEEHYFLGSPTYLSQIKKERRIPILRKDFIIDPIQVYESKAMGADAILLIMALLSNEHCQQLINIAKNVGLDTLIEVHNDDECDRVSMLSHADIIGINNRNLHTFAVDLETAPALKTRLETHRNAYTYIAESGYTTNDELHELHQQNFNAVLIGEGLATRTTTSQTLTIDQKKT